VPPVGLWSRVGTTRVWSDDERSDLTSAFGAPAGGGRGNWVECAVTRGDDYLADRRIPTVDLLKIDVEGGELEVLRGFERSLHGQRVGAIQFEFNAWAVQAGVRLLDYYDLLLPLGFTIGKIFPTYVEWRDYRPAHELLVRANFLAVHESRPQLRVALG
jgi:hypothetical protein